MPAELPHPIGAGPHNAAAKLIYDVVPELRRTDGHPALNANWLNDEDFLVGKVNALTGRDDLRALTLLPWRSAFAHIGLHRHHQARCLQCLAEQETPYQPLLWCLSAVRVCPIHGDPLTEACPFCGGKVRVRMTELRHDVCARCHRNFREAGRPCPPPDSAAGLDRWMAGQIGTLLAQPPQAHEELSSLQAVARDLVMPLFPMQQSAAEHFGLTSAVILNFLSIPRSTTVEKWSYLAWGMSLELRELLTRPPAAHQPVLRELPEGVHCRSGRRHHTASSLQSELDALLRNELGAILTMRQAAARLGVSTVSLLLFCPEHCERLKREHKNRHTAKRDALWLDKIKVAVGQAMEKGEFPSNHWLRQVLGTAGMPINFPGLAARVREEQGVVRQ